MLAIIATATTFNAYAASCIYYVPSLCWALSLQWGKDSAVLELTFYMGETSIMQEYIRKKKNI